MGFNTPIIVELLNDGVNVRVTQAFTYTDKRNKTWIVPSGSLSDGASIPRALWTEIGSPLTGKYRRAAIFHDYLYRSQIVDKDTADGLLLEAALADGCDPALAKVIYEGVHLFGESSWKNDAAKATSNS